MQDNVSIVSVASFPSSAEGHVFANALLARGIQATVVGDHTAEFRAGTSGVVNVLVPSHELDSAHAILASMHSASHPADRRTGMQDDVPGVPGARHKVWRAIVWLILALNLIGLIIYIVSLLVKKEPGLSLSDSLSAAGFLQSVIICLDSCR